MVNDDIAGGLKSALERGYPLEKSMLTLFNAKYKREEIEEAARSLLEVVGEEKVQQLIKAMPPKLEPKLVPSSLVKQVRDKSDQELTPKPPQLPVMEKKIVFQKPLPIQKPVEVKKQVQKVSDYEKEPREHSGKGVVIFLFLMLVFLIGLLGLIFIFKSQLVEFLNSILG